MADDMSTWQAPEVTQITDAGGATPDATANIRNGGASQQV